MRWRPVKPWQGWAALAWCLALGWCAFGREMRVPLLTFVNLGFHELGHLIMYIVPISEVLTAAMGSIMQCLVPLGLAAYFIVWRRDQLASAACLAWAATNFQEAAVYIADAPYQRLELIGGEHDWAFVLGPDHLDRLDRAHSIAATVRGIGVVVLLAAVAISVASLVRAARVQASPERLTIGASGPDAGTLLPDHREDSH
jgi:hypothetical protein